MGKMRYRGVIIEIATKRVRKTKGYKKKEEAEKAAKKLASRHNVYGREGFEIEIRND